jgi:hypothetical protein
MTSGVGAKTGVFGTVDGCVLAIFAADSSNSGGFVKKNVGVLRSIFALTRLENVDGLSVFSKWVSPPKL